MGVQSAIIAEKVAPLTEGQKIHLFILAGNATFTIQSSKTGTRYTFKVTKTEDKFDKTNHFWWVALLTGPDNTSSFTPLGRLTKNGLFNFTYHPPRNGTHPAVKAFEFFWDHLDSNLTLHEGLEFFHAGRCGRCGRTLTVPESVQSGFGPECVGML